MRKPAPTELLATWHSERWRPREDLDEPEAEQNHFVIAEAHLDDEIASITLLGDAPRGTMLRGVKYRFLGYWEESNKYGKQFRFEQHSVVGAHTRHGVVQYLARYCHGIGPKIAGALFDEFGSDAVDALRLRPEECAISVSLLGVEVARAAAITLMSQAELQDTRIGLCDLFAGRGFPKSLVDVVLKKYRILAVDRIKRDPWCLLVEGFAGCGFARVDTLYRELGLPKNRLKRQLICLWHAMKSDSSGNTWHERRLMVALMRQKVDAVCDPDRAIELGVRSEWIAEIEIDGKQFLAVGEKAKNERELAMIVGGMM